MFGLSVGIGVLQPQLFGSGLCRFFSGNDMESNRGQGICRGGYPGRAFFSRRHCYFDCKVWGMRI